MELADRLRKRPVDTLTRKNQRQQFNLIELYFTSEGLQFVIKQTEAEYSTIATFTPLSGQSGQSGSSVNPSETHVDSLEKSFGNLKIDYKKRFNLEKRAKYQIAIAKVEYMISIYVDSLDNNFLSAFITVKEKQDKLYTKYSKVNPKVNKEDVAKIAGFKLSKDTKIKDAQTTLKKIRARVIIANKSYK